MSSQNPIIDVSPVASESGTDRGAQQANRQTFRVPSYGKGGAQATAVDAAVIGTDGAAAGKPNLIGGAVQTAVGGAIMLLGVPMLILPGPGLLAIGGGAVIAGKGIKKMLGKQS
ncbi:hypothetical protein [Paraeggerthella hongkongensis]|uniref:Uncharacterized protein n=1 Tax=Paraeggerthella hongkongensis TaxID=230658 RepID=A0A3N0AYL2_9ACTN|nr:hypothetical protein [Paraeggerthella hongkongensis]RNL39971.1 hypothetical protein DMP08_10585 [Paraeggerthella hongkongensis]